MAHHHASTSSFSDFTLSAAHDSDAGDADPEWPFGRIDAVDRDELRETAYELFFTSCRSSPGFGGRNPLTFYPSSHQQTPPEGGSPGATSGTGMMVVNSRIKRALGLRTRRGSPPMRTMSTQSSPPATSVGGPAGATSPGGRLKQRPMTSAEIMRQQMGVTEQSDNRLRKTIMRTLVGQAGKRAETIILPLELLRQLKPSEFSDAQEYHQWQRRQLKILEAGVLLHPSTPLDRLNSSALRLREVIRSGELKPIDTSKNSEPLRVLCNAVVSLAWRSPNGSPAEACHWADGFPLNIHLYHSLLRSIFDLRDETAVLEEVDEMIELMKKTWITLGFNTMLHNVCLAWTMFEQYVRTGQIEQELLGATLVVLGDIAADAKRPDCESEFLKVLPPAMSSMLAWAERKLLDYHTVFRGKCSIGFMEKVLALALTTAKIMNDDRRNSADEDGNGEVINTAASPVERYIKSSLKSAFTKILENGNGKVDSMVVEVDEEPSETLVHLAKDTESLVAMEKETFSPVLKRWHPGSMAVAVATLHSCYGIVLKQYLARITGLNNQTVRVLQTAGKLEKTLVQMVVEDSAHCDDGGKAIVREMVPYEVESIILSLMKNWITGRLRIGRECFNRAKETETWNPKSKSEPYAQSAVDLMKLAKVTVDEFFEIPVAAREELVQELADGLETLFQDYTSFVASCGTKQSYIPNLPPLTRCNQDSRFTDLWKKAQALIGLIHPKAKKKTTPIESHHPRPSTSRATQRFYIRLNTLQYVLAVLHSIDKSLSFFGRTPSRSPRPRLAGPGSTSRRRIAPTRFDLARSSLQSAIIHVSEIAAYRLIFVDSHHAFFEGLYAGGVATARIRPSVRLLKQNLNLIVAILTDRAQPVAVREVMKAALEAFLMVLLAGGSERAFGRADSEMVAEDLQSLRRVFCTSGEGLVAEEVVEREVDTAEGIVALMALPTEKLVEEFTTVACEASGIGAQKVPMPPTTGRWKRSDPNTILRVICYRDDEAANRFLKRTFQMAKRK